MKVPPAVLKLSKYGSAGRSDSAGRNAKHVRYITTHGALEANVTACGNAAHIVYQSTHGALSSGDGVRLIGNAAEGGEAAAIREARSHTGHQWRWVVSLRGDDAERLGYRSTEDWHRLARELAPRLAAVIGIKPDAVRWVAAHHDPIPRLGDHRHPHLHIAIWSSEPLDRPHRLSREELRQARRVMVQALYGPERARLGQKRAALREAIRDAGARRLSEVLAAARAVQEPTPTITSKAHKELEDRLIRLAGMMPGRGRIALAYMPPEVKAEARSIFDLLIRFEELHELVQDFRNTVREQTRLYTDDSENLAGAERRALEDLRDRIAQVALRAAAQLQYQHQSDQSEGKIRFSRLRWASSYVLRAMVRGLRHHGRAYPEDKTRRRSYGRGRDH